MATYKDAGVDIGAGKSFGARIADLVEDAWPGLEIGGFAGGARIPTDALSFVGCADGTGTKALLAGLTGDPRHMMALGNDVVAMAVVDAYCSGCVPFGFWDVLDVAKLDIERHLPIISGIIRACKESGCRLYGGETAELPDMFRHDWMFNLNGFCVAFSGESVADASKINPGCNVYGWESKGPGSNGYSLIREVFGLSAVSPAEAREKLSQEYSEFGGGTLADALLVPTPIYCLQAEVQKSERGVDFLAHAHITGGGLIDNVPRVLPERCKAVIDCSTWPRPPVFPLVHQRGDVPFDDMDCTFNQGIMMVSVVPDDGPQPETTCLHKIGRIEKRKGGEPQVQLIGEYRDD